MSCPLQAKSQAGRLDNSFFGRLHDPRCGCWALIFSTPPTFHPTAFLCWVGPLQQGHQNSRVGFQRTIATEAPHSPKGSHGHLTSRLWKPLWLYCGFQARHSNILAQRELQLHLSLKLLCCRSFNNCQHYSSIFATTAILSHTPNVPHNAVDVW